MRREWSRKLDGRASSGWTRGDPRTIAHRHDDLPDRQESPCRTRSWSLLNCYLALYNKTDCISYFFRAKKGGQPGCLNEREWYRTASGASPYP